MPAVVEAGINPGREGKTSMAIVGLVFGGRSVEHRVSLKSARTVAQALAVAGHEVVPMGVAQDGCWLPPEISAHGLSGELEVFEPVGEPVAPTLAAAFSRPVEVVFPIIHGTWGEDGTLQGLCEMLDLPYVGTGVTSSAVCMDKLAAKQLLAAAGLPVVPFRAFSRARFEADPKGCVAETEGLSLPLFAKPAVGGSSVGVKKVPNRNCVETSIRFALQFDEMALVEQGIVGRELEVAVLGGYRLEASVVGEIVPGRDFYDYEDKYLGDDAQLLAPAPLEPKVADRLRELAVVAFAALGGWGMARVDFLYASEDELYINEINTLPGFTSISMYPRLWELSGVPLPELVTRLVTIARERHADRHRLDAGIKAFLAGL